MTTKPDADFCWLMRIYNEHTLKYYERNGFRPIFPKEENEKEFYGIDHEEALRTRMYYFDLILD